ncbi:MAG: membrane protein insertase YidC, partial [Betaproteobacteria bacterium HGW-Betaproteobacteria-20]
MDTKRLILFVIFSMSILMLWEAWQRESAPAPVTQQASQAVDGSVPNQAASAAVTNSNSVVDGEFKLLAGQRISVTTDLYKADIETTGGDLRRLELIKHRASNDDKANFVLLDDAAKPMTYVAQTGLIGAN